MTTPDLNATDGPPDPGATDFSLVLGGPLYQIYLRTRALRPPLDLIHRRIAGFVAITWVPLLVLAVVSGVCVGNREVPFLLDLDVHGRLLWALPLLIVGELIVHRRLGAAVGQFDGLIGPEDRARFQVAIQSSARLRNSFAVEVLLFMFAVVVGHILWRDGFSLTVPTWWAAQVNGEAQFTLPGYWYVYVSLPVFRFIVVRWWFRLFIWYRFLWRVSRIRLRIKALHPDRAGGLGFLGLSSFAFVTILVGITGMCSTVIGNQIWHQGASLPQFKIEVLAIVALCLLVVLLPQTFFALQLAAAQRAGRLTYGALANSYVNQFQSKWMESSKPSGEALIGSADIQSLADLANAFEVVKEMRIFPFSRNDVIRLGVVTALPFAPLLMTMISLNDIIDRLLKFTM